jgi:hypothetical protein
VKKWRRNRRKETVSFDGFSSIFWGNYISILRCFSDSSRSGSRCGFFDRFQISLERCFVVLSFFNHWEFFIHNCSFSIEFEEIGINLEGFVEIFQGL